MIKKLLVANRAEIAVRVIRAARELGIRTVAVYSEADRKSMHAQLADEAFEIGPPEPSASYLDLQALLEVAKRSGADSLHPGYGFLSERAELSEACRDAGLIFVGPPPRAMRALGDKVSAKALAERAGVPVTPGYSDPSASAADLSEQAARLGFPVMLKAAAGGGGRGMRAVQSAADFESELVLAAEEAKNAFGNSAMLVEKLIERPRHVEVQVLADAFGEAAVLFERECSLQRRHQKLVEECPAPAIDRNPELWPRMREAALRLVRESGYVGAGTVEFMVDQACENYYFLEVNARLQVEHPVTEGATGIDLVAWQLKIASGERLELPALLSAGDRRAIGAHAIEARIVAEDPARGFLPSIGELISWAEPKRPGVRVDTGYAAGAEVSRYYDSLLAKVIATAETRSDAIRRLIGALEDFHILGVSTNLPYLLEVLRHPAFASGDFDTGFLAREFGDWRPSTEVPPALGAIAAAASAARAQQAVGPSQLRAWTLGDSWRNADAQREIGRAKGS